MKDLPDRICHLVGQRCVCPVVPPVSCLPLPSLVPLLVVGGILGEGLSGSTWCTWSNVYIFCRNTS